MLAKIMPQQLRGQSLGQVGFHHAAVAAVSLVADGDADGKQHEKRQADILDGRHDRARWVNNGAG